MSLFDEVAALVSGGRVYIVDCADGAYQGFTAREYSVVSGLLDIDRFKVRLSLQAALELSQQIVAERAGKN